MRLGLLGPAEGDLEALERGANLLLVRELADRVIYLGIDDALDRVVGEWARRLVGDDPTDDGLWDRGAVRCARAEYQAIDRFVADERSRRRLKVLECLPLASSRTIEMFDGRLAVILHDKALLDEEEILPAAILVFGKSVEPVVRRVGLRTFLSPGPIAAKGLGGVALLSDDPSGGVAYSLFDPLGTRIKNEIIATAVAGRMRVLGEQPSSNEPT
jgi:hypothetical protein